MRTVTPSSGAFETKQNGNSKYVLTAGKNSFELPNRETLISTVSKPELTPPYAGGVSIIEVFHVIDQAFHHLLTPCLSLMARLNQ